MNEAIKSQSNHNTLMIVAEPSHPFYFTLIKHFIVRTVDESINSFDTYDFIIDLSPFRTQKKFLFLKELSKTSKATIISDLTLCWGEWIFKYCPQVKAALSTLFFSPGNAIEYSMNSKSETESNLIFNLILEFSSKIDKKLIHHKDLGLTFHYPRTISMIINEAFFALGEKVANATDIDLAMKNGVNYPLGPLEWGKKIDLILVAQYLEELHTITREERYKISLPLKLEAFKNLA